MTNRKIADIVKDKKFVALPDHQTVQEACRCMWEWRTGAVLVLDSQERLAGIFTGRDAVRTLAEGRTPEETTLSQAMTTDPITISPENRAIDALHEMSNHGFRQARFHRPRHCHGDLERQTSSTAYSEPADGRQSPAPRLGRSARTALLLERLNSSLFMRVSRLASRSLAKKCGVGRETVVLPSSAARDEPAWRRSIGVRKSL